MSTKNQQKTGRKAQMASKANDLNEPLEFEIVELERDGLVPRPMFPAWRKYKHVRKGDPRKFFKEGRQS